MNSLVRFYLRRWDKELNEIANRCEKVQEDQLRSVLRSPYIKYMYGDVHFTGDYDQFQADYPVITYDDIKDRIQQMLSDATLNVEYFAQSAGTTSGEKKLIPTPESFVRTNHLRGSWYLLHTLYKHNSDMQAFRNKNLLIGGSIYERSRNHIIGDISGIMINRIPKFFRPWYVPQIDIAVSSEWETKIIKTAQAAAEEGGISLLGGIPTWVLAMLKLTLDISGKATVTELWPGLQAYIHGGVSFEPYREQFDKLITHNDFRYIEVYNASEGFFAFQDRPDKEGMLLMCASGIFFEFIRYDKFKEGQYNSVRIADVGIENDYVMIISTTSGLLRYVQGDVVRFVSIAPYRIKVLGRVSEFINAFGEDLMLHHVEQALQIITPLHKVDIYNYTIAPHYLTIREKGNHDWYVEFEKPPEDILSFQKDLDDKIRELNSNYSQKRTGNLALKELNIIPLPKGTIDSYFNEFGVIGGQSKLQKLRNDRIVADRLDGMLA